MQLRKISHLCCFLCLAVALTQAQSSYDVLHKSVKEESLKNRRFKHKQIKDLVKALPKEVFTVDSIGASVEDRAIYLIKAGTGPTKVLLWSQMHGNEPTATMALFDIFNYLKRSEIWLDEDKELLDQLTLYFIPMLNPDGADRFVRRNALYVDLNRDALRAQSPEAYILKQVRDSIHPDWGFNLHDQNRYTSAGKTKNTASISFLAPAFNESKEWDVKRKEATQLIAQMNTVLQHFLPDQVGRYSDEFEPRAFGDNIQKWGTRTILIETGGYSGDLEKQFLRKMNFIGLLTAFQSISSGGFAKYSLDQYNEIPFNSNRLHELIIRNASILRGTERYILDIAFRNQEVEWKDTFYTRSGISDIGDIHNYFGYEEIDASGLDAEIGAVSEKIWQITDLSAVPYAELLTSGITYLRIETRPTLDDRLEFPHLYLLGPGENPPDHLDLGFNPALVFRNREGEIRSTLVNGRLLSY